MCICRAVKSHRTFSKPLVSISVPKGLDPADPSTGYPPKGIDIRSDHWLWKSKRSTPSRAGLLWKKTFANKGAVRANISRNGDPVVGKIPTIGRNHYAILYGNLQLKGGLQRSKGKHKSVLRGKIGVAVQGSTKSAHFFGDEVSHQALCYGCNEA